MLSEQAYNRMERILKWMIEDSRRARAESRRQDEKIQILFENQRRHDLRLAKLRESRVDAAHGSDSPTDRLDKD